MDGKEALARFKESGVPVGFLRFMANERWAIAYEHSDWINAVADELERIRQDKATLAARLAEAERDADQLIGERDHAEGMADKLAAALAALLGVEIGEHSSANCPWTEALEAFEERAADSATHRENDSE